MTPADWLTCSNRPKTMLKAVAAHAPARKARLFAVALAELVIHLDGGYGADILTTASAFADGAVTDATLRQAHAHARVHLAGLDALQRATQEYNPAASCAAAAVFATTHGNARAAANEALDQVDLAAGHSAQAGKKAAAKARVRAAACDLAREFFGPLDHPLALAPAWLLTNPADTGPAAAFRRSVTAAARDLAAAADAGANFSLLPVLADALEDGGCEDRVLLEHLRNGSALHRRGCWALDAVLAVGQVAEESAA